MSARALLIQRFKESRDEILFVSGDRDELTYGQALTNARRIAFEWSKLGAQKGDAVALVLTNDPSFPCCYLACLVAGFVAVPVNPELGEDTVRFILNLVRPAVTVKSPPVIDYRCLPDSDAEFAMHDNRCGAIFFTSGTTGRPKGVRHSWPALIGNVASFNRHMGLGPGTRMYHTLPMAYMAGFLNTVLAPLVAGGTVVIGPRFTPQAALGFWKRPLREKANTIWVTPSIAFALARLARDPEIADKIRAEFKTVLCGTAPLHPNVRYNFHQQFGTPLQESYGTSELLLVSAQHRAQADLVGMNVGSVLPEIEIAFRTDMDGRDELMIRSPFAMLGYLTENGLIPAADVDGFMPTGDAGQFDDRNLKITSRIKDLVIRGGINISPRAVEDVLGDLPGVEDVAVIGIPHQFWGEKLVVCIQVTAHVDQGMLTGAVRQRCRERLAHSCQPDEIAILDAFPRSVTGKVQKHILQRELAK